DAGEERPLDPDGVVEPGRYFVPRVLVVEDVDPAHERGARVDDRELAVQAAQPRALEAPGRNLRAIDAEMNAGRPHPVDQVAPQIVRAEAVDHDVGQYAAPRRAGERLRDGAAGGVPLEDVGFEVDLAARAVDGLLERGKVLRPVLKERNPVAVGELDHGSRGSPPGRVDAGR